jgi:D-alanine-D-alanine ligase
MGVSRRSPAWFQAVLSLADGLRDAIGVLLVANVKGITSPLDDYATDSITTEFLSNRELDDFVQGFERAGIYCEVVVDESGFVEWLNRGDFRFARKRPFIYNLAQNGTGPARLTFIPSLCRLHRLPLVDSDAYGVALDQHKFHCISLLEDFGLPVARCWWFTTHGWLPSEPPKGLRVIAKPTFESASIGINAESVSVVDSGLEERLRVLMKQFRQPITVQEFIEGFEVEVPVLESDKPRACMAVGIEVEGRRNLESTILAYDDVFVDEYGFYDFEDQQPDVAAKMLKIAETAHVGLGFAGPSRIDFRVSSGGEAKVMEVTCKPHLTIHSSFMYAQKAMGNSHSDLLKFLVGSAVIRYDILHPNPQN